MLVAGKREPFTVFGLEPSLSRSTQVARVKSSISRIIVVTQNSKIPCIVSANVHFLFTDEKYLPSLLPSVAFQILGSVSRRAGKYRNPIQLNRRDLFYQHSRNRLTFGIFCFVFSSLMLGKLNIEKAFINMQ